MLGEAIKRLREKTLTIKKSNLDPSASSDGGDQGQTTTGGMSPEEIASKAVTFFETGELSPETQAVKEFAVANGIPEAEAESFAQDVIDAYFQVDGGEGASQDPPPAQQATEDPTSSGDMEEMQKSLLAIQDAQIALAEGMEALIDKQKEIDSLKSELGVLKSLLTKLQSQPANPKKPVETQVAKGVTPGAIPLEKRKETEVAILKAIQAGELSVEEMTFFESTGRISSEANAIISKYRGSN